MTKNKDSTRYYSEKQEKYVANLLNGLLTSNSGAGLFKKGDIIQKNASLLIECKTCVSDKESFSIKKEWLDKNNNEKKLMHLDNDCLCFNFGPDTSNYFIINESLMRFLVDKLEELNL